MEGKTQLAAAAAAGMSLRTARETDNGPAPSATKLRPDSRKRLDPFAAVWSTEIETLLKRDTKGVLEAKFVLATLLAKSPDQFQPGHVRTLQRRFRDWRYVIVGGNSDDRWLGALTTPLKAMLWSPFVSQESIFFMAELEPEDLAFLGDLMAGGKVTPVVDRTYPLGEVAEAIRYLETGRARGKVIVTMGPDAAD